MTREDAKEQVLKKLICRQSLRKIIDLIYDDFERRVCSNCTHGNSADGDVYFCIPMYDATGGVEVFTDSNFGCNKFKEKQ